MRIECLDYFITVAQCLNFTKAAKKHHIAQTAMSKCIMSLERELGIRLFERDNRNVQLTVAGIQFYVDAIEIVEAYNQALSKIDALKKGTLGNLRIGIGIYESEFVSALLHDFHQKYPNIQVEVNQYAYSELFNGVNNGGLDIVFMDSLFCSDTTRPLPDSVRASKLFDFNYGVAVNVNNPLAVKEEIRPEDVTKSTLLLFNNDTESNHVRMKLAKIFPGDVILYNSLNSLKTMLESDYGICFIPNFMKNELPPIVKLIPQKILPPYHYFALYSEEHAKPSCRCFVRTIKQASNLWSLFEVK